MHELNLNFIKNSGLLDEIQSLQYSFVQVALIRWSGLKKDMFINNSLRFMYRAGYFGYWVAFFPDDTATKPPIPFPA